MVLLLHCLGYPNIMMCVFQIQGIAAQDSSGVISEGIQLFTQASMGNIPDAAVISAIVAKLS